MWPHSGLLCRALGRGIVPVWLLLGLLPGHEGPTTWWTGLSKTNVSLVPQVPILVLNPKSCEPEVIHRLYPRISLLLRSDKSQVPPAEMNPSTEKWRAQP